MKFSLRFIVAASLLASASVQADEVVAVQRDNTAGAVYGGLSGLLVGGAAGGPIGALVGGGLGLFAGRTVQDASGLSQTGYRVKTATGEVDVRSPNAEFSVGQQVRRENGRLYPSQ